MDKLGVGGRFFHPKGLDLPLRLQQTSSVYEKCLHIL